MLLNIIVALSNFTIYLPLITSYKEADFWTFCSILFVGIFSFTSHLFENHKHGMSGFKLSKYWSYLLNRMDVLGCFIVIVRFIYLYYSCYGVSIDVILADKFMVMILMLPMICNISSEYDKYNPKLKYSYVFFHTIWHISIFISMDYFLKHFIYKNF